MSIVMINAESLTKQTATPASLGEAYEAYEADGNAGTYVDIARQLGLTMLQNAGSMEAQWEVVAGAREIDILVVEDPDPTDMEFTYTVDGLRKTGSYYHDLGNLISL